MRSIIILLCILAFHFGFSQPNSKQYYSIKKEVDLLFSGKAYKEAAEKLNYAIRLSGQMATNEDRIYSASAWSLAGNLDSAFYQLDAIAKSGRYVNFEVTTSPNFSALHNDNRWKAFVDWIKKYDLPLLCTHTYHPSSPIPMTFTLDPMSTHLKSDGYGDYLNNADNVLSLSTHAYNLRILRSEYGELSRRSLTLNLNFPVAGSEAEPQGVVTDNTCSFHVFYKLDTTVKPWSVYNFRDMPIGATVFSPRTEIFVHIKGELHVLQLGHWGLGDCNEPDGKGGRNGGAGTTPVKVIRNSETSYTIVASQGSVGRLWNISNTPKTIDKGLFYTGFIVHLEYQKQ
jgi:hypothetical protein